MLKECLVGRMAVKPIAAPKGEGFKKEIISVVLYSRVVWKLRHPKSLYLQGESLFLHRDEGCCIFQSFSADT